MVHTSGIYKNTAPGPDDEKEGSERNEGGDGDEGGIVIGGMGASDSTPAGEAHKGGILVDVDSVSTSSPTTESIIDHMIAPASIEQNDVLKPTAALTDGKVGVIESAALMPALIPTSNSAQAHKDAHTERVIPSGTHNIKENSGSHFELAFQKRRRLEAEEAAEAARMKDITARPPHHKALMPARPTWKEFAAEKRQAEEEDKKARTLDRAMECLTAFVPAPAIPTPATVNAPVEQAQGVNRFGFPNFVHHFFSHIPVADEASTKHEAPEKHKAYQTDVTPYRKSASGPSTPRIFQGGSTSGSSAGGTGGSGNTPHAHATRPVATPASFHAIATGKADVGSITKEGGWTFIGDDGSFDDK